jgi:ankyrin repeat protein
MRKIAFTLAVIIALFTAPPAARAQEPAADPAPKIPRMSRENALAYVEALRLALVPSNLVNPIMSGDVETVAALLDAGVDVNDLTDMPKPALRLAASACAGKRIETETMLVMIEVLLAHGAKVNEPAPSELSALMVAAQHCPAPVVRRLVRAGADLKFKTSLGISPLSMAFITNNLDAAGALIDAGARLSPEAAAKLLEGKADDARRTALVKKATDK